MRRPNFYAPLSVTFTTDRTGARVQQEHGAGGLGVWAAMIAAAKKNQGQIVFAHDSDWQALGIITPPSFTLRAFLKTTGAMKQTRTETHGHVMYVSLTHYGDWNDDARRGVERERKACSDVETNRKESGNKPERKRAPVPVENVHAQTRTTDDENDLQNPCLDGESPIGSKPQHTTKTHGREIRGHASSPLTCSGDKQTGHHSPQILDRDKRKSSKRRGEGSDLSQPLAAESRRLLEHLQSRGEPNLEPEPPL